MPERQPPTSSEATIEDVIGESTTLEDGSEGSLDFGAEGEDNTDAEEEQPNRTETRGGDSQAEVELESMSSPEDHETARIRRVQENLSTHAANHHSTGLRASAGHGSSGEGPWGSHSGGGHHGSSHKTGIDALWEKLAPVRGVFGLIGSWIGLMIKGAPSMMGKGGNAHASGSAKKKDAHGAAAAHH